MARSEPDTAIWRCWFRQGWDIARSIARIPAPALLTGRWFVNINHQRRVIAEQYLLYAAAMLPACLQWIERR